MIQVCLAGARGRMGRLLAELLPAQRDMKLAAAIERASHPDIGLKVNREITLGDDARAAIGSCDVLLDFSPPAALLSHLEIAAAQGKPAVTGTTGLSDEQQQALRLASGRSPVVWSANMSWGVHVLRDLVRRAAVKLTDYDAEVFEAHHREKADAPSGTALQLAEEIRRARGTGTPAYARTGRRADGEVGLAAVRGGDVVGEHQVMFLGNGEQILLIHRASSREHFCKGAIAAVRFVYGKPPGLYGMADVFGEG